MTSILTCLQFSQKCARFYRPFRLSFMTFFVAQTSKLLKLFFFFKKVEKFNIFSIYKSIIIALAVNLPLLFIYKIRTKQIQIQLWYLSSSGIMLNFRTNHAGEPPEHHLGEVLQGLNPNLLSYYLIR